METEIETMTVRPYVLLSAAVSIDGHLDDASSNRLLLSSAEDFDRVDQVRADSDAILIGANTVRRDNPRLLVNSAERRARRLREGKPEYPLKVTVTASGVLPPDLKFWHHGGDKLVITVDGAVRSIRAGLGNLAEVISVGPELDWNVALEELGRRGIDRLMVEGGATIHTQLMAADLVDELHLALAPVLVGDPAATRFLGAAAYPGGPTARMRVLDVRTFGDIVLVRYAPKERQ